MQKGASATPMHQKLSLIIYFKSMIHTLNVLHDVFPDSWCSGINWIAAILLLHTLLALLDNAFSAHELSLHIS